MNFKTIRHANEKSSLIVTIKRDSVWINSSDVDNDCWIYFMSQNSVTSFTDDHLEFQDAIENTTIVLDQQDEKNIVEIIGCIHNHRLDDDDFVSQHNSNFNNTCETISGMIKNSIVDENIFQYIKRQLNFNRIKLHDALSELLTFEQITTGDLSADDLEKVKDFWLINIETHQKNSIKYLNDELQLASDDNVIEEINNIIALVEDVSVEANDMLNDMDRFDDVVKYWPNLLLPAPLFVVK